MDGVQLLWANSDVLSIIVRQLELDEIFACTLTCKTWEHLISTNGPLWTAVALRDFKVVATSDLDPKAFTKNCAVENLKLFSEAYHLTYGATYDEGLDGRANCGMIGANYRGTVLKPTNRISSLRKRSILKS